MSSNHRSELTVQQQLFVAEYVTDFNGVRAALAAKYSKKSASSQASQLLSNPKIKTAISEALDEYGLEQEILKKRLIKQLSLAAFSDITEYYDKLEGEVANLTDLKALPRSMRSLVQELKVKTTTRHYDESSETTTEIFFKLASKDKAQELLARHLGMLNDSLNLKLPEPPKPDVIKIKSFAEFCETAGFHLPYPQQVELMEFVVNETVGRLLLGARGYGKTDYGVIAGVAYKIYLDPTFTVLLITKDKERNGQMLLEIAKALEVNGVELEKNCATAVRVKGLFGKCHSVSALTINTCRLRGKHPKLVIMDDPVTPDDVSEAVRKKAKRVYNELYKLVSNVCLIGQPVHKYDLYQELRPKVKLLEMPHGTIPELDHDLEAQRLAGVDETSIQASYHLKLISDGSSIFEKIRYVPKFIPGDSVAWLDPSFEGDDYSALTIVRGYLGGVMVKGFVWKKAWHHCAKEIAEVLIKHGVLKFCIECNSLGTQPVELFQGLLKDSKIGVVGKKSTDNKHARIAAVGPFCNVVHLAEDSDQLYKDHVVQYEYKSKYDDAPDSLASCLAWIGLIRGKV